MTPRDPESTNGADPHEVLRVLDELAPTVRPALETICEIFGFRLDEWATVSPIEQVFVTAAVQALQDDLLDQGLESTKEAARHVACMRLGDLKAETIRSRVGRWRRAIEIAGEIPPGTPDPTPRN